MKKLFALLLAFLSSTFSNTSYVPADKKPFLSGSYYQLQKDGLPDDRMLYNNTIARMTESDQKCDMSVYPFDSKSGRQIVECGKGNVYFPIALTKDQTPESMIASAKKVKINKEPYYLFSVKKGTEIIAPYNSTLDNSSTVVGTVYPDADVCRGVSMTIETDKTVDGERYKITYASLNRLWCNMRKEKPDDKYNSDDNKPLYYYDEPFSDKITFSQKDVLGEAGKTGVPDSAYSDEAYVAIRVEKYSNGAYSNGTLEELCRLN